MEDTLRVTGYICKDADVVLILVLMEDTLRGNKQLKIDDYTSCLNPCFNGRYSQRQYQNKDLER